MALRRADKCSTCGSDLPIGTTAEWDSDTKTVTCLGCAGATPLAAPAAIAPPPLPAHVTPPAPPTGLSLPSPAPTPPPTEPMPPPKPEVPPPIDTGEAGASARKEHQRRQAKREARIEEKWGTGRLGRIAKALSDDPQSTKAPGGVGISPWRDARALTLSDRRLSPLRGRRRRRGWR
jgi:hypothetical protein